LFKAVDKRVMLGAVTIERVGVERDTAPARIERATVSNRNMGLYQGSSRHGSDHLRAVVGRQRFLSRRSEWDGLGIRD